MHVQYKMGDNLTICFSCPPPTNPTSWPSLPFEALFQCLDINNILTFFVAIVLERSVIIKSYHYYLLTACAEVMLTTIIGLNEGIITVQSIYSLDATNFASLIFIQLLSYVCM